VGFNQSRVVFEYRKDVKIDETGLVTKTQEVIIMVGPPASGKSTFTKKYLEKAGYHRINRDTLKTAAKCKKAMEEALTEGISVVIDNTNPSSKARAEFIGVAQDKDIPVRCFVMKTSDELIEHLNYVRVVCHDVCCLRRTARNKGRS